MAIIYGSGGSVTVSGQDSGSGGTQTVGGSQPSSSGPVTWSGQTASQTPFGQLQSGQGQFASGVARNIGQLESSSGGSIRVDSPYVARGASGEVTGPQGVYGRGQFQLASGQSTDVGAYNAAYGTQGAINRQYEGQQVVTVSPYAGGGYLVSQNPNLSSHPQSLTDQIRNYLTQSKTPYKETSEGFIVGSGSVTAFDATKPAFGGRSASLDITKNVYTSESGEKTQLISARRASEGAQSGIAPTPGSISLQGPGMTTPGANRPSLNITTNAYTTESGQKIQLQPALKPVLGPNATPQQAVAAAASTATSQGATVKTLDDLSSPATTLYRSNIAGDMQKIIDKNIPAPVRLPFEGAAWLAGGVENAFKVGASAVTFADTSLIAITAIGTNKAAADAARSSLANLKPISSTNPLSSTLASLADNPLTRFTFLPLSVAAQGVKTADTAIGAFKGAALTSFDVTSPIRDITQSFKLQPFSEKTQLQSLQAFAEAGPYTAQIPYFVTLKVADILMPTPSVMTTTQKPILQETVYAQGKEVASRQGVYGTETFSDILSKNYNVKTLYNVPGAGDVFIQIPGQSASRALLVPGELTGSVIKSGFIETPVGQSGLSLLGFAKFGAGAAAVQATINVASGKPVETDLGKAFFGGLLFYPAVSAVAFASALPGKAPTSTVVTSPDFKPGQAGDIPLYGPQMIIKGDVSPVLKPTGLPEKFAPGQYPAVPPTPLGAQPVNLAPSTKSLWELSDLYPSAFKGKGSTVTNKGSTISIYKTTTTEVTDVITEQPTLDIFTGYKKQPGKYKFEEETINRVPSDELGPKSQPLTFLTDYQYKYAPDVIFSRAPTPPITKTGQQQPALVDLGIPKITELTKQQPEPPKVKNLLDYDIITTTETGVQRIGPLEITITEQPPPPTKQLPPGEVNAIPGLIGPAIGFPILFPPLKLGGGGESAVGGKTKIAGEARDLLSVFLEADYRTSSEQPKIKYGAGAGPKETNVFAGERRGPGRPPGSGVKPKENVPKRPVGRPRKNPQQ